MKRLLKKEEYTLIERIFKCSQDGIRISMKTLLMEYYGKDKVIATKDYVIAMGEIPIGIVAHMDTVHRNQVSELFYDRAKNVMWSPEGIGADDRAGVYSMIEILRRGYKPTLILTTDEEKGAWGATELITDYPQAPCDLNFLIELDRRGERDCVFYDCDNKEFEAFIEEFGFTTNWGSFSDISYICPAWGMAGVNLSIGYENEHTLIERLYLDYMFDTIDKVCTIFDRLDKDKDKFIYIQADSFYKSKWYRDCFNKERETAFGDEDTYICWECIGTFPLDQVRVLEKENGATYCEDCYNKLYTKCITCGKDFRDIGKTHLMCPSCRNNTEDKE